MALKQFSRRNIFGLNEALDQKIAKNAIMGTLDSVLESNSANTVASTASIVELKAAMEQKVQEAKAQAQGLIDDSVGAGSDKTWSVDKIKEFVASMDDSVVVENIDQRDALNAHDSLVAYVLDTTGATELGEDEGKPYTFVFVDGSWKPMIPLAQDQIDTTVFIKKDAIVNDYTTGGVNNVASAEVVKTIVSQVIPDATAKSAADNDVRIVNENITVEDDKLSLLVNPLGELIMNAVEISTDNGIEVVDAQVSGDKEVTILPNTAGEYDGKVARVTYLARTKDIENAKNESSSGSASSDSSASGPASGSASGSGSSEG